MINLEYGQKIMFPCRPVMGFMGIAMTSSSDEPVMVEMEVSKYWKSDEDANRYKVKLIPVKDDDKLRFGNENIYSIDLKVLLKQGTCKFVDNNIPVD